MKLYLKKVPSFFTIKTVNVVVHWLHPYIFVQSIFLSLSLSYMPWCD